VEILLAGAEDRNGIREVQYKSWIENSAIEKSGQNMTGLYNRLLASSFEGGFSKENEAEFNNDARRNSLPDAGTFVAKINEKVIGFCTVVRGSEQNNLTEIYIIPAFQGKRIGRKLWEKARLFIDQNKDTTVALLRLNIAAKKFYEALGFSETGISWECEHVTDGNPTTVIEMILRA
jgi:ribosomal protein S18 acetylase RimI-like enzyme